MTESGRAVVLSLWMKSYGVTIQMKPLQQYFHMVLFVQYVVLTFESVDEILWCDHLNILFSQYFRMVLFVFQHSKKSNLQNFVEF